MQIMKTSKFYKIRKINLKSHLRSFNFSPIFKMYHVRIFFSQPRKKAADSLLLRDKDNNLLEELKRKRFYCVAVV